MPCTLELGGKCPVIVGASTDLNVTAMRARAASFGLPLLKRRAARVCDADSSEGLSVAL